MRTRATEGAGGGSKGGDSLEQSGSNGRAAYCVQAVLLLPVVLNATLAQGEQDGHNAQITRPHGGVPAHAVQNLVETHLLGGLQRR